MLSWKMSENLSKLCRFKRKLEEPEPGKYGKYDFNLTGSPYWCVFVFAFSGGFVKFVRIAIGLKLSIPTTVMVFFLFDGETYLKHLLWLDMIDIWSWHLAASIWMQ